jgi:Uncharacterised nucleotidyltransferase
MPPDAARLRPDTQAQLVRTALAAGRPARIAMRGTSMLPLLHEPMVLELDRFRGSARVGEIVVFRTNDRLVAHRVVGRRGDALLCAGDAQPGRLEVIDRNDVVGAVAAVWSSPASDARRIDGALLRVLGIACARTRPLRAFLRRALPWSRPRTFATLYATIGAIVQNGSVPRALLENADPFELAYVAKRHGCAELLHRGLEKTVGPEAATLRALLQRDRWSTALRTAKLHDQLRAVIELLNAHGIEPILLKGAARLWSGGPAARLHDSVDLDLLVDESELEASRSALLDAGYRDDAYRDVAWYYQDAHHHLAPLFPQRGVPVELHRALAPPGRLSLDTRRARMRAYAVECKADNTRTYVLNRVAAALHLAVHVLEGLKLRDLFLLAEQLAEMDESEYRDLRSIIDSERLEPIRLHAIVYAGATAAGLRWQANEPARRFARWMLRCADLPRPLRRRPACVDACLGADAGHLQALVRAAWHGNEADKSSHPLRPWARLLSGLAIAFYWPFMQKSKADELFEDPIDVFGDDRSIDTAIPGKLVDDRADSVRSVAKP